MVEFRPILLSKWAVCLGVFVDEFQTYQTYVFWFDSTHNSPTSASIPTMDKEPDVVEEINANA